MLLWLNNLPKQDFLSFSRFVRSPYFNSNKKIVLLMNMLEKRYPEIREKHVTIKWISNAVKSRSILSPVNYRKLLSDFTKLFEDFLVQNEIDKDETFRTLMLLRDLRKRNIKKRFDRHFNEIMKKLDRSFSKDGDYYFLKASVVAEKYLSDFAEIKHEYSPYLQMQSDCLDYYYLFEKLHVIHQMHQASNKRDPSQKYSARWHHELLDFVGSEIDVIKRHHPNIYVIYLTLKMLEDRDDSYLKMLIEFLGQTIRKMPDDKLRHHFSYAVSYCISKINSGDERFRKFALDLYKKMDQLGLLTIDGSIMDSDFSNVVNISISEKELDYAEDFAERYRKLIVQEFAKDAYSLAKAKILYFHGKYDEMFRLLGDVEYRDPNYYINSKFLTARAYADKREREGSRYIIENLKQYGRMNAEISEQQKKSIRNFVKYYNLLVRSFEMDERKRAKLLGEALSRLSGETGFVPAKSWFLEKFSAVGGN